MARVQIVNRISDDGNPGEYRLELQWCRYLYDDGDMEYGYRFIWIRPDGSLQAARGQTRLPSLQKAAELMKKAKDAGWGDYEG